MIEPLHIIEVIQRTLTQRRSTAGLQFDWFVGIK